MASTKRTTAAAAKVKPRSTVAVRPMEEIIADLESLGSPGRRRPAKVVKGRAQALKAAESLRKSAATTPPEAKELSDSRKQFYAELSQKLRYAAGTKSSTGS